MGKPYIMELFWVSIYISLATRLLPKYIFCVLIAYLQEMIRDFTDFMRFKNN